MINYRSTRGHQKQYKFSEAILRGLAIDGGLLVPEKVPALTKSDLKKLVGLSYQQQASFLIKLFQPDFSPQTIDNIVRQAYSKNFDNEQIVPLKKLKDSQFIQELWHGPTSAFKDLALQMMPLWFAEVVKTDNLRLIKSGKPPVEYLILVATSGDTGKAALEGYKDKENIKIVVFYPEGKVSQLQKLQMITQEGKNVKVYAVQGDFDDAQSLVKDIFNDSHFNDKILKDRQTALSSANSINWGRLLPQIIYHFNSYLALVELGQIKIGEKINISVPTGNFGNIMAAFYAKKMGLPINKLICASNTNCVLTEFIKTGKYDLRQRILVQTPSPSMDILVASNIERLLYEITKNPSLVSEWMNDLKSKHYFVVDKETKKALSQLFYADWVSNEDCLTNIKDCFNQYNYLIDPHTSVAQVVANRYAKHSEDNLPNIVCSTAHWSKFASDVYQGLNEVKSNEKIVDEFVILNKILRLSENLSLPSAIANLKNKPIKHEARCLPNSDIVEQLLIKEVLS